jgi:hypothetical protein
VTAAAAEALPRPQAITASVFVDPATRSVAVRLRDTAGSYERSLWVQSWQRLRRAQENGWPPGSPLQPRVDLPGARQVVPGQPIDGAQLLFSFPVGVAGFASLVAQPKVTAIVTVDRNRLEFLSCRVFNQRAVADVVGVAR